MSWDAFAFVMVDGHEVDLPVEFNYTHNTNRMIREAGWPEFWPEGPIPAAEVEARLATVIDTMSGQRRRFEAMNPENGWGSYETLLPLLENMRSAAAEYPSATWRFHG